MTSSFSRDTGLLCADAQLLLWGIKPDYAGFALERLELGSSLIPQTKLLATAPVYPCCSLPFVVVPKRGHSSPSTPAVSYGPASTSSSTLSTLLISSTDWRESLMQVFQWNLYDPDVNPVASPSGLDMSGNEHYWADKISEHFFPQETHWFSSPGLARKLPKAPAEAYLGLPVTRYEQESSSRHEGPGWDGS